MKTQSTFEKYSVEWFQNYITLKQLSFLRAMDRNDIHAANIACAQKMWGEKKLAEMIGEAAFQI